MTAQERSCHPPSALTSRPGNQDAPAGLQAKSFLLIGQVFTNQHIMESLAYKEELRAQRPSHVGPFPASPPVPIMTAEHQYRLSERGQGARSVSHLSGAPSGYGELETGSQKLQTGPLGSAVRRCPEVKEGRGSNISITGTFMAASILFFLLHLNHPHVWARKATAAPLPTSFKAALAGLHFTHPGPRVRQEAVNGQRRDQCCSSA